MPNNEVSAFIYPALLPENELKVDSKMFRKLDKQFGLEPDYSIGK